MSNKLTTKQQLFVSAYCSNGFNGTQAALEAGYSEATAYSIANENLKKPEIIGEIDKYKASISEKHMITVEGLIKELEEARQAALSAETPQSSAAISATMGKAKLCGLDKQIIDHQSSDGSMTPKFSNLYGTKPGGESKS